MKFGLMFFRSVSPAAGHRKYDTLLKSVRFADEHGFDCVWIPERHFHEFGGLFPNPSVLGAALAMSTQRLQIRAGSVIPPLHNPIRVAEEWSVVDNLSGGRVALGFGSGWNVNDFVFHPERHATRDKLMYQQIEIIHKLWRGEGIPQINSLGREVEIKTHPRPIQPELPVWITSAGNIRTFVAAGAMGANLLTNLEDQGIECLPEKIGKYRQARGENGHAPQDGIVSLMLHTFVGPDTETVRARVRQPMWEYLKSAVSLKMGGVQGCATSGAGAEACPVDEETLDELVEMAFERYFERTALLGSIPKCKALVDELAGYGVDEIACLIDFIDDEPAILESLAHLRQLKEACA